MVVEELRIVHPEELSRYGDSLKERMCRNVWLGLLEKDLLPLELPQVTETEGPAPGTPWSGGYTVIELRVSVRGRKAPDG